MPDAQLTHDLKTRAAAEGFVLAGTTAAANPARIEQFHHWLDAGYAGTMQYLADRREAYAHPSGVLEGCRSLLMLAIPYSATPATKFEPSESPSNSHGKVARYARGELDYHDVIHAKLKRLKRWLQEQRPNALVRGVVDTAPLLEREFAEAAGLGWIAKNTLLINKHWGSYFFLAALLTDLELELDAPHGTSHCGTCTACLDACPTGAFASPYVLDASKCISYWTIEHRGPLIGENAQQMDGWIFGCDVCQEVCPWNRKQREAAPEFQELEPSFEILEILELDEPSFRERFRGTPMWRSRRRGLLRNAILLAASKRLHAALPAIVRLVGDDEPLLRVAAAWALRSLGYTDWESTLRTAIDRETEPNVREEMQRLMI